MDDTDTQEQPEQQVPVRTTGPLPALEENPTATTQSNEMPFLWPTPIDLQVWHGDQYPFDVNHPVHREWLQRYRQGKFMGGVQSDPFEQVVLGHRCDCVLFSATLAALDSVTNEVHWIGPDGEIK